MKSLNQLRNLYSEISYESNQRFSYAVTRLKIPSIFEHDFIQGSWKNTRGCNNLSPVN